MFVMEGQGVDRHVCDVFFLCFLCLSSSTMV